MALIEKFNTIVTECELHITHLDHALERTAHLFPLSTSLAHLSLDDISFLDQLIFRFSKLQDSIGNKLIPVGLNLLNEPVEKMTMLDMLNRLEKLSVITSSQDWMQLRELRNEFTHDYPDDDLAKSEALNLLQDKSMYLKDVFYKILAFVQSKIK